MANQKNLIPIKKGELSKEEAKKRGQKGGIKSGEVRRARKTLKEDLLFLLEQGDTQEKISVAMIKQALKGNVKAFAMIRDTIGEKPVEKQEITGKEGEPLVINGFASMEDAVKHFKEMIGD